MKINKKNLSENAIRKSQCYKEVLRLTDFSQHVPNNIKIFPQRAHQTKPTLNLNSNSPLIRSPFNITYHRTHALVHPLQIFHTSRYAKTTNNHPVPPQASFAKKTTRAPQVQKSQLEELSATAQNLINNVTTALGVQVPDTKQVTEIISTQTRNLASNVQDIANKLQGEVGLLGGGWIWPSSVGFMELSVLVLVFRTKFRLSRRLSSLGVVMVHPFPNPEF